MNRIPRPTWLLLPTLLLAACATHPPAAGTDQSPALIVAQPRSDALPDAADVAAAAALQQIGRPYRYGGTSPAGFDCSGLVHYAYLQAGMQLPRSSLDQYRETKPVPREGLRRGDLLFFSIEGKVSHVAIYLDSGHFVHAPASGRPVEIASLDSDYYRRHFLASHRVR